MSIQTINAAHKQVVGIVPSNESYNVSAGGRLEFTQGVIAGTVVNLNGSADTAATLKLDDPENFHGVINFNDGVINLGNLMVVTGGGPILDWHLENGLLKLDTRFGTAVQIAVNDLSPGAAAGAMEVSKCGDQYYVTEGTTGQPAGATLISGKEDGGTAHSPVAAIYDTTTQAAVPDTFSQLYTGPVAGIQAQLIDITEHSLNISAKTDNLFIKTGYGNDAIALKGGTNVVDAGGGSNFITPGTGFDTIFLNMGDIARIPTAAGSVPGSIWDTVQGFSNTGNGFSHGDAITLWGVGPSAKITWQHNEGALGYQGETMHALLPNGAMGSLTFAGFSSHAGLSMSYGKSADGADYLYVKAA